MGPILLATRATSSIPEFAGSTWVRLQYMLGLRQLGLDAYWVDRLGPVDSTETRRTVEYLAGRFHDMARAFGFEDRYCIQYAGGARHFGLQEDELRRLCADASLVISVSEAPPPDSPLAGVPRRAYVDVDPGFAQIWAQQVDMGFDRHNVFFTIGQTVGTTAFPIDVGGIEWHRILPPVALDAWPVHPDGNRGRFTTVADWRGSQRADLDGIAYLGKRPQFLDVLDLPSRLPDAEFELALLISPVDSADMERLIGAGWKLVDPYRFAGNPESYRLYVQYSGAEFSVAKHGYVESNSGWISDRTACYLASGKPALVQSTGFEGSLPVGEGLLTFRNVDEAAAGAAAIQREYAEHSAAARRLAEELFDARKVLSGMLDVVGL